jgi:hypothetical protein
VARSGGGGGHGHGAYGSHIHPPFTIYAIWPLLAGLIMCEAARRPFVGVGGGAGGAGRRALGDRDRRLEPAQPGSYRPGDLHHGGDYNLKVNHAALLLVLRDGDPYEAVRERLLAGMPDPGSAPPAELARPARAAGLAIIRQHPFLYARILVTGAARCAFCAGGALHPNVFW